MPGRQRAAARKIAAIEMQTTDLLCEFYKLMPEMYRERLLTQDPLSFPPPAYFVVHFLIVHSPLER